MHFRKRRSIQLITTAAAVVLLMTGCSQGSQGNASKSPSTSSSTESVSVELLGPVTSLDPAKGSSFQDAELAWALYDPLVNFNQNGTVIPGLATTWDVLPTSATFHLHTGVTCSDGTKLTPSIVAASLQRYLAPATNSPLRNLVIGAGNSASVTADDQANTITISLSQPWSQLLAGLTSPFTGIVCPSGLANPANLLTQSSGTGPYVAVSEVSGATYTLRSQPNYTWGPPFSNQPTGRVPKTLVFTVVQNDNTAANLMSGGSLTVGAFTTNAWQHLQNSSGSSTVTQPQSDTMLVFNENPGHPTATQSVRLAISQALNRQALANVLGNGHGLVESNLGQSTYHCYDSTLQSSIPSYNVSAATSALRGMKIRIIGTTLTAGGNGTSYLLSALQQAGVSGTLQNMNNEAWVTDLFTPKNDWDLTILVYGNILNTLLSAAGFFTGPAPPTGENLGAVDNSAAATYYAQAGAATGESECAATTKLQRSLLTRNDVLPLAAIPDTVVFAKGSKGVVTKGFVRPGSIRLSG